MASYNLQSVLDETVSALMAHMPLSELSAGAYASMRYPKFPAMMRFSVRRYAAPGFGNAFSMYTRAMGGLMQLATLVLAPNAGTNVPLMLIDAMALGKKRAAFVEYYDCTAGGAGCPALSAVQTRYADLPDYPEKSAWYVGERMAYSLIKGGTDDARLAAMLRDSADAYAKACAAQADVRPENLTGLREFIDRMVSDGNPSSATMERVLGKEGAERFFRTVTMPSSYTEANL